MSVGNVSDRRRAEHLGPERRRPQVLDTALAIAANEGIAAVSMGSVAQRLGVTRPVVYACFTGRAQLLGALLDREEHRLVDAVFSALPTETETGAPGRRIVDGFRVLLEAVSAHRDSWQVVFGGESDPALVERTGLVRAQILARVATMLEPVLAARGVTDTERKLPVYAELCVSYAEGAVRALLTSDWSPAELAELTGRTAFEALQHL
jgi:AcrR family transcriptional regulator